LQNENIKKLKAEKVYEEIEIIKSQISDGILKSSRNGNSKLSIRFSDGSVTRVLALDYNNSIIVQFEFSDLDDIITFIKSIVYMLKNEGYYVCYHRWCDSSNLRYWYVNLEVSWKDQLFFKRFLNFFNFTL
jgi:hypothetical protein